MRQIYTRSFYPGRFQPFHKGHFHAIKYVLDMSREVVIGVTAAQFNFLKDNPFTAGERVEMVKLALGDEHYRRCYVIPLDNVTDNAEWLSMVESKVPRFEAVFTNNVLVELLAKRKGYKVHNIPFKDRENLKGSKIQELMASEKPWRHLIPEPVARFIDEIDGEERIRKLYKAERIPLP